MRREAAAGRGEAGGSGLAVIVVTSDRREEIELLLGYLAGQSLAPDEIVVVGAAEHHLPEALPARSAPTRLLVSESGTCRQRNVGLDALGPSCRYVLFLDDDYVPARDAVEAVVAAFERTPELAGLEGVVLADGVTTGGIDRRSAERRVREDAERRARAGRHAAKAPVSISRGPGLYGCNMAYRRDAIAGHRFDERLPLYGWQEDVDFAARVSAGRPLGRAEGVRGVHRGVSRGRSPGLRIGYSQVANPHYLVRKGTLPVGFALRLVARNLAANHWRAPRPEPWIDRAGRVRGNWRALGDLVRGRLDPGRIVDMD